MTNFFKIASVAIVALSANVLSAQEDTDQATLNVVVGSSYSITVSNPTAEISMTTPTHFQSGNSVSKTDHVQVSATNDYEVTVIATQDLTSGAETIPVSTVLVTPTLGSYLGGGDDPGAIAVTLDPQELSTSTENTIISTDIGESLRGYNIEYSIPAEQASQYLNHTAGTYTTTVTYSLYAQ